MMDVNDKDANLGVGMVSAKFGIRTRLHTTSGAGVNAASRVNLANTTPDLLSELVWSPHVGVSLKPATSSDADKKPFLMWNVGSSSPLGVSPLHSTRLKKSGDDDVVDDMIIEKVTCLEASESRNTPDSNDSDCDRIVEEQADRKDAIQEETGILVQEGDSCHLQIVQPNGIAETSQEFAERCEEEIPSVATLLKKSESSAENASFHHIEKDDCCLRGTELPEEDALPASGSLTSSRNCLYPKNGEGKGEVLSDGDIYGRSSHDEDGSHDGSDASFKSARIYSTGMKGRKRHVYDHSVLFRSKSMKNQIDGSPGSTRPSSFMNWISNMTKVSPVTLACPIDVYGQNEDLMCLRPQGSASVGMGFQTIFESEEESREKMVDDENLQESCDRNCGNSSEHTILCSEEVNPIVASKPCLLSSNLDQFLCPSESNSAKNNALEYVVSDRGKDGLIQSEMNNITAKEAYLLEEGNPLASVWITRLFPRAEKGKGIGEETSWCSTPCTKADLDSRMDVLYALRHISSSKKRKLLTCLRICFFCGEFHDVRECPNITKPELEDILLKLSTLDCDEVSSCLCIRCSRSDHWAIACPLSPSSSKFEISSNKSFPTSSKMQGNPALIQIKDISPSQKAVAQLELFDAIRNLQLTRADILRWMDKNFSLSHFNGCFLRLRLGKLEAGRGSSGYYVACIAEDARYNDGCMSKKSILVDVGGIKSSVSCQYVSNHDFLEDEIKNWLCITADSGCKIPSLVELKSKLNDRKTLGF